MCGLSAAGSVNCGVWEMSFMSADEWPPLKVESKTQKEHFMPMARRRACCSANAQVMEKVNQMSSTDPYCGFAVSPGARELYQRLDTFITTHVYPNEERFRQQIEA